VCLTLETSRARARYNRGARKAQKRITVGWARAGRTREEAVRFERALRGVFPGVPIYLIQVRDDGPGKRRTREIQDTATALSMETRLR
jgi:hypothetical protein